MPVTVSWKTPWVARWSTTNVRVEVPLPVTEVGVKDAVTSGGNPLMLRFTVPVKPLMAVMVTVSEPLELRFTVIDGGAEMPKSPTGTGSSSKETETVRVRVPSVPVMVNG